MVDGVDAFDLCWESMSMAVQRSDPLLSIKQTDGADRRVRGCGLGSQAARGATPVGVCVDDDERLLFGGVAVVSVEPASASLCSRLPRRMRSGCALLRARPVLRWMAMRRRVAAPVVLFARQHCELTAGSNWGDVRSGRNSAGVPSVRFGGWRSPENLVGDSRTRPVLRPPEGARQAFVRTPGRSSLWRRRWRWSPDGKARAFTRRGFGWRERYRADRRAGRRTAGKIRDHRRRGDRDRRQAATPTFGKLRSAMRWEPERLIFVAFDLLHLDGEDLRFRPVIERRADCGRWCRGDGAIQFSAAY